MRVLEVVTLSVVLAAGFFGVTPLAVPLAALALMIETVFWPALRLRQLQAERLSSKSVTYLVLGGLGWLIAVWAAYVAGVLLRASV